MTDFKCPNCSKHSNKFCNKCPECGYVRLQGKDIQIKDGTIRTQRELERKRRLDNSKFRGGRNKSLIGVGDKSDIKRKSKE